MMLKILAMAAVFLFPLGCLAEPVLLMAQQSGCYWCGRWDQEIAPVYPKTAEGRAAPLQRFELHSPPPGVMFSRKVHFTPTFILLIDGKEVDRLEGYPGEDFFWGLLGAMLERADVPLEQKQKNDG